MKKMIVQFVGRVRNVGTSSVVTIPNIHKQTGILQDDVCYLFVVAKIVKKLGEKGGVHDKSKS